jgi:hypothetical protein
MIIVAHEYLYLDYRVAPLAVQIDHLCCGATYMDVKPAKRTSGNPWQSKKTCSLFDCVSCLRSRLLLNCRTVAFPEP